MLDPDSSTILPGTGINAVSAKVMTLLLLALVPKIRISSNKASPMNYYTRIPRATRLCEIRDREKLPTEALEEAVFARGMSLPHLPLVIDGNNLLLYFSEDNRIESFECLRLHGLLKVFSFLSGRPVKICFDGNGLEGAPLYDGSLKYNNGDVHIEFTSRSKTADDVMVEALAKESSGMTMKNISIAFAEELLLHAEGNISDGSSVAAKAPAFIISHELQNTSRRKSKRARSFLRSLWIGSIGQRRHVLSWTARQRSEARNLTGRLRAMQDFVTLKKIDYATSLVVSNDHELRRRCEALGAIVLFAKQFHPWLHDLAEDEYCATELDKHFRSGSIHWTRCENTTIEFDALCKETRGLRTLHASALRNTGRRRTSSPFHSSEG